MNNNASPPQKQDVPQPNAVTLSAMDLAERGECLYGPFDSVADLMDALNS